MNEPTGKLSLTFRKKQDGQTYVAHQYYKLPLQVMQPYYEDRDGTAFVYLLNPSGGVLQHDRLFTEIRLEEGSRALLTTPSNMKFYKMDDGFAQVENKFYVESNAALEYLPEHNVPFAGSKAYQNTDFHLAQDATLIASDMMTAGRISRGEIFDYGLYSSHMRIYVDGKLKLYNSSHIEPASMHLERLGLMEGHLAAGSIYAHAPRICDGLTERIVQMERGKGIRLAAGKLDESLLVVRFLGNDVLELRIVAMAIWNCLRESLLGKPAVRIRKY